MKKSRILTFLLICIPLLIAIGFSSWIIIYEVVFSPTYQENPLSEIYGFSQSTTYNGEEQVPEPLNGETIDGTISYQYKLEGESEDKLVEGNGPIDAGVYDVIITVTGNDAGVCQVKFTINKKKIKLVKTTIPINYTDCEPYWSSMSTTIKSNISFLDGNNVAASELVYGDYYIEGMHNGVYYYGDSDYSVDALTTTNDIAGSTYISTVYLHEDLLENYEFSGTNEITIKYKTVKVNGVLYTIEDAIALNSGDMILLGNESQYIETCFSKVLSTDTYSIQNSRTLKVPYDVNGGDFERTYQGTLSAGVYSALMIPEGITINFVENSNSRLIVGSLIDQVGTISRRGVIMNNGTLNFYSSCFLGSYGYTKGNGLINIYKGAEASDVFRIYDWPGAGDAVTLKSNNAFPVKEWSVYNISCKTRVYKDGLYNSISFLVALNGWTQIKVNDIFIIGNDSTNNCLFKPSTSSIESDYIEKAAIINNDSYTVSNQVKTVMNKINICGDYIDSQVLVNASGYEMQTSTSMAIPLNYFEIHIQENALLNISASSYILLSSSTKMYVEKNAELTINGNAYIAFLNDSKLIMNGAGSTLSGSGTIGGKIEVNAEQSVLSIANYDKFTDDANPVILKTGNSTYANQESIALGNIKVGNEYLTNQQFTDSYLYISEAYSGNYYYVGASKDEYNTYTINYHTNGGDTLQSDVIPSFDNSYTVTFDSLQIPNKDYYELENWYTDENCTSGNEFTEITLTSTSNVLDLYAKWKYKNYKFTYTVAYENSSNDNELEYLDTEEVLSNLNSTFTYETLENGDLTITTTATYQGKEFYGWYVGVGEDGVLINNTFKLSYLTQIVEEYDIDEIPLYGVFKDYRQYTIYFTDNNDDFTKPSSLTIKTTDTISLPNTTEYNDNTSKQLYCEGWYYTSDRQSGTKVIDGARLSSIIDSVEIIDGNKIYLYGNWLNKIKISYNDYTGNEKSYSFYKEGTVILVEEKLEDSYVKVEATGTLYTCDKTEGQWTYNNTNYISKNTFTVPESNVVFSPLYSTYTYCEITVSSTKAATTLTYTDLYGNSQTKTTTTTQTVSYTVFAKYNTNVTCDITDYGDLKYGGYAYTLYGEKTVEKKPSGWFGDNTKTGTIKLSPITKHVEIIAINTNEEDGGCLVQGTLITLFDGTKKPVEDLIYDDLLLIFNHETGKVDYSPASFVIHFGDTYSHYKVINLLFENSTNIKIADYHGFYDKTLNKYVYINEENIIEYIGHEFYVEDGTTTKLVDYTITEEYTRIFSPISYYHLNVFANGILTVTNFSEIATNIFEYDENMKYDEDKMKIDIETYGLFTYDDFKEYASEEIYNAFPAQYFKVAIGKGKGTYEDIIWILNTFLQ